jgi:glucosamine-6-phosphate deaminase
MKCLDLRSRWESARSSRGRHIVLLASGVDKADAVKQAIEGPISTEITASALQLHPRVTVFLDEAAAEKLKRKDYYKYVESMRQVVGQAEV